MINSRNEIIGLLKEYSGTQQDYVCQLVMPEVPEWNVERQVAYVNGIVLGKFRENDFLTMQVMKEGVTNQALHNEIKRNLEYHIKMIEEMEQPDIMQLELYKKQYYELSYDPIDNWISKNCGWIQEYVMKRPHSEIKVLLYLYYSFENYNH